MSAGSQVAQAVIEKALRELRGGCTELDLTGASVDLFSARLSRAARHTPLIPALGIQHSDRRIGDARRSLTNRPRMR
eukprot:4011080-Prymnesium_polylepis.1